MSDDDFDDDLEDVGHPSHSWGMLFGILGTAAMLGTYYVITSPIWVPIAAYQKIKSIIKAEPKPQYRGTVRPMVPITEIDSRKTDK